MSTPIPLKSSATRPRNAFPSNARIPLEYCDGPTQRIYAVSTFMFLQALKIYYWLGISRADYAAEFFGFLLWLSLDAAFLLALNYLRIPWLELPILRLITALMALTIINYVLFTAREISPTAIVLSILSKDRDEHLLGRHTVLIKPYSTAILNPDDQCFCVPSTNIPILDRPEIPIIFNGSEPHYLEYSITSFETGKTTINKLSGPFKDSKSILHKAHSVQEDGKSIYNLRASIAGAYKLHRILDKNRMDVRFYHDKEVYVVNCPEAHIDHYKDTLEYCAGKGDAEIPIVVRGLPPWTITYRRHIGSGNNAQDLLIESEPPEYTSPLLKGWSPPATPNYSWAKQHEMNLSVSLGLSTSGEYGFQVVKVKDGCGNVIDIQGLVIRNLREPEIRHVNVRQRPAVAMKCDPRQPIKIVDRDGASPAAIGLELMRGSAPFHIGYVYQKSDLDEPHAMPDVVLQEGNISRIDAKLPGVYTLSHVKDAYCEGEIEFPRDCSVIVATRPTVDIISHPINDSCVGAIGVTVDATFTGEAPWEVCFQVWRNNQQEPRPNCYSSTKPRLNLELKPRLPGNYQYKFTTVSDRNYHDIEVDLPPIFQNIHPQPSAVFVENQSGAKACRGSTKTLDVELYGEGPWDIEYRVIRGTEIRLFQERNINQKLATLTLPPFEKEGMYSVDLGKVTDLANGCEKDLNVSDVTIEVSNGPPTASFQCDTAVEFAEGEDVDLPIHLTGGTPWRLSYGMVGEESLTFAKSDARNALITVNKPGIYELKSVSDSFCEGEVVEQARLCEVAYSKRPTMNLMIDSIRFRGGPRENVPEGEVAPSERISREGDHFVLPSVCKDADRTLELRLTGKAPFKLQYKRVFRSTKGGREESKTLFEESQHSTMRLPIMTDQAGTISYVFETLSDATYQNVEVRYEKRTVIFKHVVRSPPTATLINTAKQFYCKNEITGVKEKIAIQIQDGQGPYSLAIEIMRPNQAVPERLYEHDVVPQRNGVYEWTLPAKFTYMGLYKVSVVRVTDINGCSAGSASTVEFDILDTPSITPLRSITDACVGDKIEYSVQGEAPPFKIFYSLDQINHTATIEGKRRTFSHEATKSGLLKINKVCQTLAKKQCCTQPLEDMSTIIWAIPTVKIADGTNVITDLREGDRAEVVATFVGEPPFSWSYVRTEAVYDKEHHERHKRPGVLEKRTVELIPEHKYTFFTAIEGTIVPVWIKDKHCQFGKEL
ncbi:hypothetical protein BX616_001020 [Lobosporangium transversale]|nr:hypothetical protein BX616_001020 [Lobosporangium transversale]